MFGNIIMFGNTKHCINALNRIRLVVIIGFLFFNIRGIISCVLVILSPKALLTGRNNSAPAWC